MKFSQLQYLSILPFDLRWQVLRYWLKRIFRLSYTQAESDLDQYLQHLLTNGGVLEEYAGDYFCASYVFEWGKIKVMLRKTPHQDFSIFRKIIENQFFRPVYELIEAQSDPASIRRIIDAGANLGFSSLYLNQKFPQAEIVCLEPIGEVYEQLLKNLNLNASEHLIPLQIALWNDDRNLEVLRGKDWELEPPFSMRETLKPTGIKGLSVETLLEQRGWEMLDLLKLDIEGSEMPIFDDTIQTNLLLEKVRFVAMHIYDEFGIRNRIYKIFEDSGFEVLEKQGLMIGVNKKLLSTSPTKSQ